MLGKADADRFKEVTKIIRKHSENAFRAFSMSNMTSMRVVNEIRDCYIFSEKGDKDKTFVLAMVRPVINSEGKMYSRVVVTKRTVYNCIPGTICSATNTPHKIEYETPINIEDTLLYRDGSESLFILEYPIPGLIIPAYKARHIPTGEILSFCTLNERPYAYLHIK